MEVAMMDDLGPILNRWKYIPSEINVRLIDGVDGKKKVQMRLDLGIIQMELDGRPDGRKPYHCDSYLSYFEKKASSSRRTKPFMLNPMDCLYLQQEAIQFYHRYLALMKLNDYSRVVRDTERNLRVIDFVAEHVDVEDVIWSFEQYRAYILMMHCRAQASLSLENSDYDQALKNIEKGIRSIQGYYNKFSDRLGTERFEIEFLKQLAKEIRNRKPLSERERLGKELEKAVLNEEYEQAAVLRDKIQKFGMERKGRKE
jgi:hypothetical protein